MAQINRFSKKKSRGYFDQNDGVPGVIYILGNAGFAEDYYKIGCSRYSGEKRARSLNEDATTGTPGEFFCIFEYRTFDCGLAEKRVFKHLDSYRAGKKGQEYFRVKLDLAKAHIIAECQKVDKEYLDKFAAEKPEQLPSLMGTRRMMGRYACLQELTAGSQFT
jgi:hypothetical protein